MRVAAATLVFLALLVSACDNGSPAGSSPPTQTGAASTEVLYRVHWPTDGETFVRRLVEKEFGGARRVAVKCRSLQRNAGSCEVTWRGAEGARCNASLSVQLDPHEFDQSRTTGLANCTGAADFDFVTAAP
jgi:hypothetical protein